MWRPSLPKLEAGKSDNDCPDPDDYCEVCIVVTDALHLKCYLLKHISSFWITLKLFAHDEINEKHSVLIVKFHAADKEMLVPQCRHEADVWAGEKDSWKNEPAQGQPCGYDDEPGMYLV